MKITGTKTGRIKLFSILTLFSTPLLLLAACGGGGGGGGGGGSATAGSVRSVGQITAKGSVFVNGVEFNTANATITMDGQQVADDNPLRVGMVVEVEGEINADGTTGTATIVNFDDTVQGTVANKNADGSFTVMGKQVFTDQATMIDDSNGLPRGFDDVTAEVEISGQVDDQGRIVATHIQLKPGDLVSEITGVVDGTNPLTVAGIPVITDTPPALGALVEVKGTFDGTSLTATSIELNPGLGNDDNFHFEGFVISGDDNAFTISGHHLAQQLNVTTGSTTVFEGGNRTDLIVGTKVEVDGVLTGSTVAATKVQFRENVRFEMPAGTPDADLETIELANFSAHAVKTNALTRFDGGVSFAAGDTLEIRGRLAPDGSIIATRFRNRGATSNPERVILRGPADVSGSTISMLGVSVDTSGAVQFRANDDSGSDNAPTMTRDAFMAAVKSGTVIKVRGTFSGANQLVATEIELED